MAKIFIIEDDRIIRTELCNLLSRYGYDCEVSDQFETIVETALQSNSQLILLDVNLPYFDGYHVCREIRKQSSVPIIIVTSRDSELDELMSMNLGADDFIVKPYNTQILLARIASVLRRSVGNEPTNTVIYQDVCLDISKSIVSFHDKEAELSKNEMRILHLLMKNREHIISRNDIMNDLWQSDEFVDDNTLTVNINRLRKKLEEIGVHDFLVTKRGQGYMIG
ncbi:response regulator transcription factor [Paludicola sp. MB14-C6]|uniref:response regulator transcription factor n=1 Tax=Paludihabitans sp. MB14-C6 TaxID=3070656 RepID=UPI0027DD0EAD|nr:response regulator transcription factor [Paludicola sp. MB14-C6]WMJ23848.1 response regulator transcription factor [Paludicola sp. MB14-C6]